MKRNILIILLLVNGVFAQKLSYFQFGGRILQNLPNDSLKTTFRGLGSMGINWGKEWNYFLGKSKIFVGAGYEINVANYRFDKNVEFGRNSEDKVYFTHNQDSSLDYTKSKLNVIALQIPVQIGFYAKKFLFEVGGFGGITARSLKREKFSILPTTANQTERFVVRNSFYAKNTAINLLQYGVFTRIGYKWIGAYVKYYFSPLFDANRLYSPSYNNVNTLEFGLSVFFMQKKKKNVFEIPGVENKKTNDI